jgi:nitrite reductase (NAD(P)H)
VAAFVNVRRHKTKSRPSFLPFYEPVRLTTISFGLIATEKGFNIFVGGNGGASPKHSELLAKGVPPDDVVQILDRYLMFYIRTADKLQRTARWLEKLPGGINYLREVILDDKLGICASLEEQMEELVGTFYDEWVEAVKDPERKKHFQQFANTTDTLQTMETEEDRGQSRPVYWTKESVKEDFKNTKWTSLTWQPIIEASHFKDADISPNGISANIKRGDTQLAVFKVKGKYYCTQQMCPHKRAFVLSDGLIGDDLASNKLWVSCPYHKRNYELSGESAGKCTNDDEVSIATFPVEERDDGMVYLKLPPVHELDGVLGTSKWMIKKQDVAGIEPFKKLDARLGGKANGVGMKGRKPWDGKHLDGKTVKVGGDGIDW